jgi:type IV pilus assembly protein PilW
MNGVSLVKWNGVPSSFVGLGHSRASQLGLTLVEMMIAMVLGLLILLAVSSIYIGSRQTFRMQDDNARLQETGRYALEVLGRSVRQAGFWNMPINPVATATAFGGTPITGADGAAGASDTVTVQYDYLAADRDCEGTVPSTLATPPAFVTDAYRLTANNLVCDGVDTDATFQPLVSDIDDVQILYGIDTTNDQSADRYVAAPANWAQVVSARVCVQARSANNVNNAPQTFLNCGGALGTATGAAATSTAAAGDFRLRRTFVATYNLRNRVTSVP